MVAAGITDSNPLQQQQPSSSSSAVSVEDEALKRNTDCVYFLASPLTCKKGSECEYRHSEYARVNPRDCYYWLNGSCLNPKCAFRHPPLDGLLGTQVTASGGPSMPPSYPAPMPVAHASYNHGKQAVPCIFFQKGFCVKGDKCAFLHGPNPLGSKVLQAPPIVPSTEPPAFKKPMVGLQKCNQEPKPPQLNMLKSNKATPDFKIAAISENAQVKNAIGSEPLRVNDESWRSANFTPAANGKIIARSNRTHQAEVSDDLSLQNGLDADDYHRESSPGFDVIVDDETGQSEYYHDDEQYGRAVHDGRKGMKEFDMDHSTEYDRVAGGDHEMVHDSRGYYSHKQMAGQYAWEEHRGSAHSERRRSRNSGSPENESDLRHHLAKQRKGNGLRSVINHEFARDNHNDGRRYHDSHRDSRHTASHDSSLSNRLGDRLKPPRRSPPLIGTDLPSRRDMDSGRSFGRLSPGRPPYSSHQGRFQDRIRGRVQDDSANQERGFRGQRIGRDGLDDFNVNFAGPKSLAELKGSKNSKVKEQLMMVKESFSLGKRKNTDMDGHQQSEGDVSFEGPKPLSEILKRKRGETSSVRSEASTGNISENNQNENKDNSVNQEDLHAIGSSSEIKPAGNTEEGQSSQVPDSTNKFENEDGMNLEEGEEYPEGYEEGEEYYYEQDEEGEYNLEEGENVYGDEEYPEEEEGAESGDKMGVVYS